jgi:hypothetical protein
MVLFHNSVSQTLFGTQTFRTHLASQTDLLQRLGVQIVRLLISWRQLEENGKSQYQSWYLDSMDKDIQAMTQNECQNYSSNGSNTVLGINIIQLLGI